MNDSVLFLGVGHLQRLSIEAAKKAGFKTLGVDINPTAPCANLCDYFLHNDSREVNNIYNWCESIVDSRVVAVWANNDILIQSRFELESLFDIAFPHANKQTCQDLLSKVNSSLILDKTGFVPKQYKYEDALSGKADFPLIVKPKQGSGSKGVKLINNRSELEGLIFDSKDQLIEEYIDGIEFGTNHFYDGKNIFKLPAVRRYFCHELTMVPLGTVIADMTDLNLLSSYKQIENIIIQNNWLGPLKADIFLQEDHFNIIEMSPRFHGEIDTTFVFDRHNLNVSDMYFSALKNPLKLNWEFHKDTDQTFTGYISVCNKSVVNDNKYIRKTLRNNGLDFLSYIPSGGKGNKGEIFIPENTSDLTGFIFYTSSIRLDSQSFTQIYKEINSL